MKTSPYNTIRLAAIGLLGLSVAESSMARPLGVDVSHYQGSINWTSVHNAGYAFAWAKATEGTYGVDDTFVNNENNGKAAGVLIGGYHFARPDLTSPTSEENYYWAEAGAYTKADGKTLMPMLDMETFNGVVGASSYADWANQWCNGAVADAAANGVHIQPFLYTTTCESCSLDSSMSQWISDIANPSGESAQTGSPWDFTSCGSCNWWGGWTAWQYDWHGIVSGITGEVDRDVINGSSVPASAIASPVDGHPNVSPLVIPNGLMELYAIDSDSSMYFTTQSTAGGSWLSWNLIPGTTNVSCVSASLSANGHAEIFGVGTTSKVYHTYYGTNWSAWSTLGSSAQALTAITSLVLTNGCQEVFGVDSTGALWTITQSGPNAGWNSTAWSSLGGGGNTVVSAVKTHNGNPEVFVGGLGKANIFSKYWNGSSWSGWNTIPAQELVKMSVTLNGNGEEEIFGLDSTGQTWTLTQTSPGAGWNSSTWLNLGGGGNTVISAVATANGNPAVFVGGPGKTTVFSKYFDGSSWSSWYSFTSQKEVLSLVAALNSNGEEELFGLNSAGSTLWTITQTGAEAGWNASSWISLGGSFK